MLLRAYGAVRVAEDYTRSDCWKELVADPSKARVLEAQTARILTTTALAALNALNSRELAIAAERSNSATSDRHDRLMNIDEAAERLGGDGNSVLALRMDTFMHLNCVDQ